VISSLQNQISKRLIHLIDKEFGIQLEDVVSQVPPQIELGDLAFPVAFDLAKRIKASTGEKRNPREIATQLAEALRSEPGVARIEVAGAGYLNLFFDRGVLFKSYLQPRPTTEPRSGKMIVEHTSINPNKAAHIGHVRNAVLGDTLVRVLKETGETIEVHNYIDNTGVQVADVVVGFLSLEHKYLDDIKAIADRERFDYYCWDLYARVGAWYEADKSRLELRSRTLYEIEAGEGEAAVAAEFISTRIVECHLKTMARLGIGYDLLARESDVLHLHFWAKAFEKLKASGAIVFETEGRHKGCWVLPADESEKSESSSDYEADKIIVRSNGTVTYTGKDIAYNLWKLGKLGLDFYYRPFQAGGSLWVTTSDQSQASGNNPAFGNGTAFLNVIDVGQSYLQTNVKRGVMAIDHDERVARSEHLAYEKVTLTPAAAAELGMELSEADAQRQQIGMSGRKGLGVKADDLIDRLETDALAEVAARHADIGEEQQREIAHQIAIAAFRYFLLKFTRTSIIAFDFEEALSFDGETGPYVQYSVVRANNIFRKLGSAPDFNAITEEQARRYLEGEEGNELWSLISLAARFDEVVGQAAENFEPTQIAKYTFQLAKQFNLFYHSFHVLSESDEERKLFLLAIVKIVRDTIERGLSLLGISVPERM
jgi:arginyl-tRNA synthetase